MTIDEYTDYFKAVAKSNRIISHEGEPNRKTFRRANIEEILSDAKPNLTDISLVIENPEMRGRDLLSDNPRKLMTGAFLVIMRAGENFDKQQEAFNKCGIVLDKVLSKISNDWKKFQLKNKYKDYPFALKGFDVNSVQSNAVANVFDGWYGWRTVFSLNQTFENNLKLKEEDWFDDTPAEI